MLNDYLMKKGVGNGCYSFFISEIGVWLCGMHLGYITKNIVLFR